MTRVLYVEDEALLAISMEGALVDAGCTVELAYDGEAGIERALEFSPEVIVTDFMMPRMDGLTMIRVLKDKGLRVPVVLTTAVPEHEIADEIRDRVDVYLPKPFREQDLIAAVSRLVSPAAVKSPT